MIYSYHMLKRYIVHSSKDDLFLLYVVNIKFINGVEIDLVKFGQFNLKLIIKIFNIL